MKGSCDWKWLSYRRRKRGGGRQRKDDPECGHVGQSWSIADD